MATKFSKSKSSADNANRGLYKKGGSTMKKMATGGITKNQTGNAANRGLMKKGGSMKYQPGGTAVEPKRKVGDTAYGKTIPVIKITGNNGNPQGAAKSDTVPVRYGPPVRVKRATGIVVKSKYNKGGSTKKK
jgi:hypothetical protein